MDNLLPLYKIFHTVANTRNISAAAKELYISQPAISKAISKLEQSLNVTLFTRNSRGVTLTYEGQILYAQISQAFHSIELGEEQLRLTAQLGIGHLSIGVSTTLCKFMLLPYLKEFTQSNPHIQISISCQSTFQTLSALEKGDIDIGLTGEPEHTPGLTFFPLMEIQDVFVSTTRYLDNLKLRTNASLDTATLTKEAAFMMLDRENLTRKHVDRLLRQNNIQIEHIIEATSMDLLIDFAKIDLGIACVFKEFVTRELEAHTLTEIPLPITFPKRQIGIAHSDKTPPSLSMQKFIDFYKKEKQRL